MKIFINQDLTANGWDAPKFRARPCCRPGRDAWFAALLVAITIAVRPLLAGVPEAAKTNIATNSNPNVTADQSAPAAQPSGFQFPWFHPHPFNVAITNSIYAWTAEDGRDTNIIRQLAHNELEYRRMVLENAAIYRRQLVYFTQSFVSQAQPATQTGQSLRQITLPGLDGQELTVNVTRTEFKKGGSQGQIYGQLPGRPDSLVTVAFVDSREAFTIISPQDQIYLQAEAREPGEVVVKNVNPALFGKPAN